MATVMVVNVIVNPWANVSQRRQSRLSSSKLNWTQLNKPLRKVAHKRKETHKSLIISRVVKRFSIKFDYQNFLSFLFSIYRNRILFPILRCATVLTYRDRRISYMGEVFIHCTDVSAIGLHVSADTECNNDQQ